MALTWRQLKEEIDSIPEDKMDEEILLARQKWGISYLNHHIEKDGSPQIIYNQGQPDVVLGTAHYTNTDRYAIITSPF